MIILGYSVAEISDVISKLTLSDLINTTPISFFMGGLSIDEGVLLKKFIGQLFEKKNIPPNITFQKLKEISKMNLHLVVTNLTRGEVEHITSANYPDLSVLTAIAASMSVPLLYPPSIAPNGDIWVDGGVAENFPMMKFDPHFLLGFDFTHKIDSFKLDNLYSYVSRLLKVRQIPIDIVSWKLMSKKHRQRTILLDTENIEVVPTSELSAKSRELLIKVGYNAAIAKIKELETNNFKECSEIHKNIKLPYYMLSINSCNPLEKAYI